MWTFFLRSSFLVVWAASVVLLPRTAAYSRSHPIFLVTKASKLLMSTFDADYFNRPGPWDEKNLSSLLGANRKWAQRMKVENPGFFDEIKRGHAPKILWIGCSDARVPANEIIGEPPGSVFVHRNIANQVISTDFNCMSVIQFAVDVLKVKHIIVCGHYDCGGVRAATELTDHRSPLENWLRNIRDTYRLHKDELDGIEDVVQRRRRLVEVNVIEQVGILSYRSFPAHLLNAKLYDSA
jgi:carbonic anhydrase